MQSLPIFAAWRDEIQCELVEARGELEVAKAELEAAQAGAADARNERAALKATIERIGKRLDIPAALFVRFRSRDQELSAFDGDVTRAKQSIASALSRIADRELAAFLLDELCPPPEPAEEPELAEVVA